VTTPVTTPTTTPLNVDDLYHTGIVVPDLEAAAERLSTVAGYRWTRPIEGPLAIRTADGSRTVDLRFAYSLQRPHIELIHEVPGTPWVAGANHAVHHLGYFTDDLAGTASALEAHGFTLELCPAGDGKAPSIFAYYLSPDGVRVEIVDRTIMGDFDAFLKAVQ
jgi:catechol 2,3-dioxygenase-like lactoylglutathione lyase family enzyme